MSTFRNSTVPEWAANENIGYFRRNGADSQSGGNRGAGQQESRKSSRSKEVECLPQNTATAAASLKQRKIGNCWLDAFGSQMFVLILLFAIFPMKLEGPELNHFWKVFRSCMASIVLSHGIMFLVTLFLRLYMFGILMTGFSKYGLCIQQQINRFTSIQFLLKPLLLVVFINLDFEHFLEMFDPGYSYIFRSTASPTDCGPKSEDCFFLENNLVIRIAATVAALDFFLSSFANGLFSLQFPAVPVKSYSGSLLDPNDILKSARRGVLLTLPISISCLLVGPFFYCTILYPFGIKIWEAGFLERVFLFLNIGFIIRLLLYTVLTRSVLPILLKLLNYYLTESVHFHIEKPTDHQDCLSMHEAMQGDNIYLKHLAFYDYNCMGDGGDSEVSVFFKITHPGNHPLNWRNVFVPSVAVLQFTNECILNFLKSARKSPNYFQFALSPYILNQLREQNIVGQQSVAPNVPVDAARAGNMRDLTSSNRPDFPNHIPTITEAVRQNLELLWNDVKAAVLGFFTMQTVNNLAFGGRLDVIIQENAIFNILSDYQLSYWALMGTHKLMCLSSHIDGRGVVHQDIKPFIIKVLEAHDVLTALDIFMSTSLDDEIGVNKNVLEKNKEIVSKLTNTCVFVLAKLHETFSSSYQILGVDDDLQSRIQETMSNREHS